MAKVTVEQLSAAEQKNKGISTWPIWEKEVSRFDWSYDSTEECLLLEGEVIVETDDGNYTIRAGDFVTFESGLSCVWNVKKPVRKHYNFR